MISYPCWDYSEFIVLKSAHEIIFHLHVQRWVLTFICKCCHSKTYVTTLLWSTVHSRNFYLTHWGRVTHKCWLVACSAPSHYLNQCWNIVSLTLKNKLQWNVNRNSNIFIHENECENVVCEIAALLCRLHCVKLAVCSSLLWYGSNQFYPMDVCQGHFTDIEEIIKILRACKVTLSNKDQ